MPERRRTFRVAERIRELIAWELQRVADPRFHLVTITSVMVTADLRLAKVYWMVSGDAERRAEAEEAFEHAEGMFKRVLASQLNARVVPALKFYYDDTLDVSEGVLKLLEKVKQ